MQRLDRRGISLLRDVFVGCVQAVVQASDAGGLRRNVFTLLRDGTLQRRNRGGARIDVHGVGYVDNVEVIEVAVAGGQIVAQRNGQTSRLGSLPSFANFRPVNGEVCERDLKHWRSSTITHSQLVVALPIICCSRNLFNPDADLISTAFDKIDVLARRYGATWVNFQCFCADMRYLNSNDRTETGCANITVHTTLKRWVDDQVVRSLG